MTRHLQSRTRWHHLITFAQNQRFWRAVERLEQATKELAAADMKKGRPRVVTFDRPRGSPKASPRSSPMASPRVCQACERNQKCSCGYLEPDQVSYCDPLCSIRVPAGYYDPSIRPIMYHVGA